MNDFIPNTMADYMTTKKTKVYDTNGGTTYKRYNLQPTMSSENNQLGLYKYNSAVLYNRANEEFNPSI